MTGSPLGSDHESTLRSPAVLWSNHRDGRTQSVSCPETCWNLVLRAETDFHRSISDRFGRKTTLYVLWFFLLGVRIRMIHLPIMMISITELIFSMKCPLSLVDHLRGMFRFDLATLGRGQASRWDLGRFDSSDFASVSR
jgi:hypothetical protein